MSRAAGVAAAGVLLLLLALTFDAAPLFVPAIGFIALGAIVPSWVALSARGSRVERRFDTDRVVEGEPLEATLEVRASSLGLPGGAVDDPLVPAPVPLDGALSPWQGARTAQVRLVTRFPRRGLHHLDPPCLIVTDTLELARSLRTSNSPAKDVLVLPRTEAVQWAAGERTGRSDGTAGAAHAEPFAAVDIDGLRPYRTGTPASRIHWSALARGAGLLERRLQADGETRPLVILDARGEGPVDHLDAAVRAAASLVLELARTGGCGLLLPGERRPLTIESDLAAWPSAHAKLALVEQSTRAPVLAAGTRPGPVIYVAAQPLERVPAGLAGAGSGARILVLPMQCANHPAAAPSFSVSGCQGFVLRAAGRWKRGPNRARQVA
jgi:uncharacterized protein (DUF58 family)